jgi:flap endonuclease-1
MGVKIFDLVQTKELHLDDLNNKTIVIDGNLNLYQFLSSIRQRDGTLLMDSHGNITSHLTGLFNRTIRLMQQGVKVCYVFDGKSPDLKKQEQQKRQANKEVALKKYEEALEKQDIPQMKKFASRTSKLTKEMVTEAKQLLHELGLPVIQAPSEGEAQASKIVSNGHAYAVGSQDADCLMFGATRMIKNLTINTSRKSPNKLAYQQINPELIELKSVLSTLDLSQDQFIALGLLVGTDFNPRGIPGVGPKNALKNIKKFNNNFNKMFTELKWGDYFDFPWEEAFNTIKSMPTIGDYELKWSKINHDKIKEILCTNHDFSLDRVSSQLEKLDNINELNKQSSLSDWP